MNRTNSKCALPSKAAEDRRTPRRCRVGHSHAQFRQVLECADPAALWISQPGSWSQCIRKNERGLSMNLPFILVLVVVLDPILWFRGRERAGGRSGSWSQCTASMSRGLSRNGTGDQNREIASHRCACAPRKQAGPLVSGPVTPPGLLKKTS